MKIKKQPFPKFGDIVRVHWRNGVVWEGVMTDERGFWDNREEFREWYWLAALKVRHDNKEPSETSGYFHFDTRFDTWEIIGHDDNFKVPSKRLIRLKMIQRLKRVLFSERIGEYRHFQNSYPYLSFTYSKEHMIDKSFQKVVAEITTVDEFLSSWGTWSCKAKFNKEVSKYLKEVVFPMSPKKRVKEVMKIHWGQHAWKDNDGVEHYYIQSFNDLRYTIYRLLFVEMLKKVRTPDELVKVMQMWGTNNSSQLTTEKPKNLWLEKGRKIYE